MSKRELKHWIDAVYNCWYFTTSDGEQSSFYSEWIAELKYT